MSDGKLLFETGIDNSGFNSGISNLAIIADNAIANIASNIVSGISSALAQIPTQMVSVGSGFEASMSQVAATMGITSAAAEFETLSNAAKEMGETTKFSASQAGEALNYLALAGYDAEKAVSALPTVLNVAAAGGMELAAASDMITDAMSALGLETSQMADFADKLAVTSQKSNTSVSQLGEAILTVGGTAKNLAGGVTEMNTVLGILADNGIKGAEGGTALRNVILSLTAPTSTAAEAIDSLGLSVFDNQGKMRSLQDIIYDLNDALSTMTDADKSQALSDIFNKVDLKSINALLGTSAERFDELSGYIDSCSGAAADMAATMDDNLKGDLTIMQSALEGLGIAAYEKFQTPMRTAVQSVTEDIGTLSHSISGGELSESFDKLSKAASDFITTVADGAANTLPKVINVMAEISDHAELVKAGILSVGGAIAAANIATQVTAVGGAVHKAALRIDLLGTSASIATLQTKAFNGELSLTEIVALAATGNINLLQLSLARLKAEFLALNPVMLGITAAALALGAAMIALNEKFKIDAELAAQAAATDPWLEQAQNRVSAIKEEQKAFEDLLATQKEQDSASQAEANNIQKLWSELQNYVDENGNVVSSNERVSEIIGTLNSAYSMNIEYMNGQIQGYGDLADSMDDYIEKLRLEAKLRNLQPAYDEAIVGQEKYNAQRLELEKQLNEKIAAFQAADNNDTKGVFAVQIGGLREEIAALDETYAMYQDTIAEYEGLFASKSSNTSYKSTQQMADEEYAANYTKTMQETAEKISEAQAEATAKLKEGWEQAEHDYAIGVIGSEEELIAEKQRIWNEYGDESCADHWRYYEDLIGLQNDYADNLKKANEQLAEEQKAAMRSEWNEIEHQNSIGLLNDEDTYKDKLAFIQKYCPEYSDEWYEYYKNVYDYQQAYADKQLDALKDSMEDQIDVVKDSLKDIVSKYKSAYSDIKSNIDSYKNKLLSLGDAFSVVENEDGSKTLKVNNLKEQMAEMRKYTEYVKKLKEQGASQGLLEELTSMDAADGMEFAKNLANMSSADFAQINDYYKQRDELAQELAEDLYSSDVSKLNEKLVNDISEQFGMLPEEIQAIGAESVNAFIAGLGTGDLSEQVDSFIDSFGTDLDNGLNKMFENWNESITESIGDSVYEAGKTSGQDFVEGFNEALAELEAAVTAEQAKITAEYSGELKYDKKSIGGGDENGNGSGGKKIVVENHLRATLEVDGKKLAETVAENQNTIDRGKGK
ncbi:MAG: phage tail tape measure protein [Oscillospiraceae bacterium]